MYVQAENRGDGRKKINKTERTASWAGKRAEGRSLPKEKHRHKNAVGDCAVCFLRQQGLLFLFRL